MKKYCILLVAILYLRAHAQQSLPVTDSLPAMFNGLQAGYVITDASEKEVGSKGNFSRYKLRFYVTNTTQEAKIFYTKPAFFNGSPSNTLVRFMCSNATGARLTNKEASIQMQPATILADVEDKDAAGKTVINHRPVNIGYWIQPGETISTNTIMITPLGEKPAMTAVYYPYTGTQAGVLMPQQNMPRQPQAENFVHIKNYGTGNYLQLEQGPLQCTPIDQGWWSAQWEIQPVPGTNYSVIKNRYRHNFLALDNTGNAYMAPRGDAVNAMWTVEEAGTSGTYYIRNASNEAKLLMQNNMVRGVKQLTLMATTQWIIAP